MKYICFLSHSSELNGAELNLLQILERIDKQKFKPFLIVPQEGLLFDEAKKVGIEAEVFPSKWWLTERGKMWKQPLAWIWNIRAVLGLARWIKNQRIDLVFSNSSASSIGALSAKRTNVPHVWYIHEILGGETPQLIYIFGQKTLARKIVRCSRRVLVNSLATEEFFEEKSNVQLVYNGIQPQPEERPETQGSDYRWGLDDQDVVFGMVGKICEEKGQREVIAALGMLGKDQPWKLMIVGEEKSKTYLAELVEICIAYDIEDRVIFTGYQRDVFDALHLMDCLIVASNAESFGRTIIEAMSVKTPVIAVKSGGIPEIISHGTNGFLLSSRKPEVIKEAIVSFLNDRKTYERTANMGYRTVQEKFHLSSQVQEIEKVLEDCLEEHGGVN
jgi:glycosyltransferase involved in cell wall biosynthesis